MVSHSGTAVRPDRLRPLNRPRPIRVETDERGYPIVVGFGRGRKGQGISVAEIVDRWRIDDEWWRAVPAQSGKSKSRHVRAEGEISRAEISRMYYHVSLENRQVIVIFRDLIDGRWYAQTTATPLQQPEPMHVLTPHVATTTSPSSAQERKSLLRSIGA